MSETKAERLERGQELAKSYAKKGLPITGGWEGLKLAMDLDATLPPPVIAQMRSMFYAGAHHAYYAVCDCANLADRSSVEQIHRELEQFAEEKRQRQHSNSN